MLPFILGTLIFAQLAMLGFYFFGVQVTVFFVILYVFAFGWARQISRNDDQRLLQLLMKVRMRGPQIASRRFWGAISFSPLPPRK